MQTEDRAGYVKREQPLLEKATEELAEIVGVHMTTVYRCARELLEEMANRLAQRVVSEA